MDAMSALPLYEEELESSISELDSKISNLNAEVSNINPNINTKYTNLYNRQTIIKVNGVVKKNINFTLKSGASASTATLNDYYVTFS